MDNYGYKTNEKSESFAMVDSTARAYRESGYTRAQESRNARSVVAGRGGGREHFSRMEQRAEEIRYKTRSFKMIFQNEIHLTYQKLNATYFLKAF